MPVLPRHWTGREGDCPLNTPPHRCSLPVTESVLLPLQQDEGGDLSSRWTLEVISGPGLKRREEQAQAS